MATVPAFQLDDVSKRFGARWALARLSFTLEAGGSLLLTGHNGSGKTTLLKLLGTSLSPTAGRIRILGKDSQSEREETRRQVGLLSHASFLYEDLSALQNLVLYGKLLGVPDCRSRAVQLLDVVGLSARSQSSVREFSAGMRKRLALARLLLKEPRLALLDEPFGELDPAGIALTEELIRSLLRQGTALVLATHLVEQGAQLCQTRLHLSDGRAVAA
jgi:heme exporter protein A